MYRLKKNLKLQKKLIVYKISETAFKNLVFKGKFCFSNNAANDWKCVHKNKVERKEERHDQFLFYKKKYKASMLTN